LSTGFDAKAEVFIIRAKEITIIIRGANSNAEVVDTICRTIRRPRHTVRLNGIAIIHRVRKRISRGIQASQNCIVGIADYIHSCNIHNTIRRGIPGCAENEIGNRIVVQIKPIDQVVMNDRIRADVVVKNLSACRSCDQ
jgi:hypothetical protein